MQNDLQKIDIELWDGVQPEDLQDEHSDGIRIKALVLLLILLFSVVWLAIETISQGILSQWSIPEEIIEPLQGIVHF